MLDQLMDSLKGEVVESIASKAGISADQAQNVLPIATETLQSGLMEKVTGGGIGDILGMFNSGGGLMDNPLFGSLKSMLMKNVMTKMGLPESVAGMVAGSGMGSMIGGLAGKLGGAGNITQDGMMEKLGLGGGALGALGGLMGNAGGAGDALGALGGLMGKATDAGSAGGGLADKAKDMAVDAAKDKLKDITGGLFGK